MDTPLCLRAKGGGCLILDGRLPYAAPVASDLGITIQSKQTECNIHQVTMGQRCVAVMLKHPPSTLLDPFGGKACI